MVAGAGLRRYIADHRDELASVVLEVHLEHAAREFAERTDRAGTSSNPPAWSPRAGGSRAATPTSRPPCSTPSPSSSSTARCWWRPTPSAKQPPTDGGFYHAEGVPIVNFLAAPFYLFDAMDTLDKVDRANLVPLTGRRSGSSSRPAASRPPRCGRASSRRRSQAEVRHLAQRAQVAGGGGRAVLRLADQLRERHVEGRAGRTPGTAAVARRHLLVPVGQPGRRLHDLVEHRLLGAEDDVGWYLALVEGVVVDDAATWSAVASTIQAS